MSSAREIENEVQKAIRDAASRGKMSCELTQETVTAAPGSSTNNNNNNTTGGWSSWENVGKIVSVLLLVLAIVGITTWLTRRYSSAANVAAVNGMAGSSGLSIERRLEILENNIAQGILKCRTQQSREKGHGRQTQSQAKGVSVPGS